MIKAFTVSLIIQILMAAVAATILVMTIIIGRGEYITQLVLAGAVTVQSITLTGWYSWARTGRLYLLKNGGKK